MAILNCGLVPIHPLTLIPNDKLGVDVYLFNEDQGTTVKFLGANQHVTEAVFSFFLSNPHQRVFIAETSVDSYMQHLHDNFEKWIVEPRVPRILKTTIATECIHSSFAKGHRSRSIEQLVESSIDCSLRLIRYAPEIKICGRELQKSLRHDSSFVTHAVNTSFLVYMIAKALGYHNDILVEMCTGALLHDIGKIDSGYLKSSLRLSEAKSQDWTERSSKTHPIEGFRRLCHLPGVTEVHLMMCYQHHEQIDGQGFPVGLLGNELHEASRICSVANRYDRLTSNRTNRPAITRMAALRVMEAQRNTILDSEFFRCLDRIMSEPSNN
jgi:HD-GYP domain-containing protein (c-di-GMP phosphodiesterase class II)